MGNGFGEKLRAERLERGLTQAELGTTPQYAALDWQNETIAVLSAAEHRPTLH